jgi:hypothetical protein
MTPDLATEAALNDPENLYLCWRRLEDGTYVALGRLMYTTALYIGVNATGAERRYCFTTLGNALGEYHDLQRGTDEPMGWIARRPETPEDILAKSMPGYVPAGLKGS